MNEAVETLSERQIDKELDKIGSLNSRLYWITEQVSATLSRLRGEQPAREGGESQIPPQPSGSVFELGRRLDAAHDYAGEIEAGLSEIGRFV